MPDRAFSRLLRLLLRLVEEELNSAIHLNLGRQPPEFYPSDGREVSWVVRRGEPMIPSPVGYPGQVCVNLSGIWRRRC